MQNISENVKDFVENYVDEIEDQEFEYVLEQANDELDVDDYNELIEILLSTNVIESSDAYAKYKTKFDEDDLETAIEDKVSYECRCKFLSIKQHLADNELEIEYISQEKMDEDTANIIEHVVNKYIVDNHPELIGTTVDLTVHTRQGRGYSNHTYTVDANKPAYQSNYEYHVIFSADGDIYAEVEAVLLTTDDLEEARYFAERIDEFPEHTVEQYGKGLIYLLKVPRSININDLSGSDLLQYMEDDWYIS